MAWLATDFVTDVTDDGLLCCMKVRDGWLACDEGWLATDVV